MKLLTIMIREVLAKTKTCLRLLTDEGLGALGDFYEFLTKIAILASFKSHFTRLWIHLKKK